MLDKTYEVVDNQITDGNNDSTNNANPDFTKKFQFPLNHIDSIALQEKEWNKIAAKVEKTEQNIQATLESNEGVSQCLDSYNKRCTALNIKLKELEGTINAFILKNEVEITKYITKYVKSGKINLPLTDLGISAYTDISEYELNEIARIYIDNLLNYDIEYVWMFLKNFLNSQDDKDIIIFGEGKEFIKKFDVILKGFEKFYGSWEEKSMQIDNIKLSINDLYNQYNNGKNKLSKFITKIKQLNENLDDLNKKIFLDSYLSSDNTANLENFIASPDVEKKIRYFINLNKNGEALPKTILFYGGHNTGKTFAGKVLSNEINRKMYHIKSYDIFNGSTGSPSELIDVIFGGIIDRVIKKNEKCVIFLDEMEDFGEHFSDEHILIENTIRHHISKIKESKLDIMIIGAVSDKCKLNPKLLTGDIFNIQILFDKLDGEGSKRFLDYLLKKNNARFEDESIIMNLLNNKYSSEYIKRLSESLIFNYKINNEDYRSGDEIILTKSDLDNAILNINSLKNISNGKVGF